QVAQPLVAEPLEAVWRSTGLVGSSAQDAGPGGLYFLGDPERQFLLLHGAGPGHDRHLPAADLHAIHVNDRVVFLELAARELPGRQNRDHLFDSGDGPEWVVGEQPVVADHADDGPLLPLREVGTEA